MGMMRFNGSRCLWAGQSVCLLAWRYIDQVTKKTHKKRHQLIGLLIAFHAGEHIIADTDSLWYGINTHS